jgi:hypothetical protein
MLKLSRMGLAGHTARIGEKRDAYKLMVGKPEGKRPLRRTRCRWVDNNRMHLKRHRMGCCRLDWSGSGQGHVKSSC